MAGHQQMLLGVTPAAGGSAPEWIAAGSMYDQPTPSTTHNITVPAGAEVGDMLLLAPFQFGTISSVDTNTSQNLPLLADYASPGEIGHLYGAVITGSVPTTITLTFSSANDLQAQALVARGVTAVGGIVDDGDTADPITTYPYTATVANSLVFAHFSHNSGIDISTATFNGADAADSITNYPLAYLSNITGVHDGSTGANTFAVTWTGTSTGGRWLTVELVP